VPRRIGLDTTILIRVRGRAQSRQNDGAVVVADRRLGGVPFYQSLDGCGIITIITCHGPNGIYGALIDAVSKRWPERAAA
jgi:hypothetical protein